MGATIANGVHVLTFLKKADLWTAIHCALLVRSDVRLYFWPSNVSQARLWGAISQLPYFKIQIFIILNNLQIINGS
jgi:hypothetical protein